MLSEMPDDVPAGSAKNIRNKRDAILSTSKGVITDKEARDLNVGGEVICYVY